MIKNFRLLLASSTVLAVAVLAPAAPASAAFNPFAGACNGGQAADSAVCKTNNGSQSPITGPNGVLLRATRLIAIITGAAAVIVIILAGIRYITAAGDKNSVAQAKQAIIFAAVGLLVIALAQTIISFVITRI